MFIIQNDLFVNVKHITNL